MRKVLYILGQMTDQDVEWLGKSGARRSVPKGTAVIQQGKTTGRMLILLDGMMSVEVEGLGQVAQLHCGDVVGEMSFVDSRPPAATVVATSDCTVLDLSHEDVARKLDQDVGFSARFHRALARFLSDRMRATLMHFSPKNKGPGGFDDEEEGELGIDLLDDVHMAGARFDRMLKKLMAV